LPWPGNISELQALLTRLTLLDAAGVINAETVAGLGARTTDLAAALPLREVLNERIRAVHHETAGNISETARRLRVSRNTVYRALPDPSRRTT
jgi:transcriptional regulator of acetoin/glycerol metabolism